MATIDQLDLKIGERIRITALGSVEISVLIRESGGRLILQLPMNCNSKEIILDEEGMKIIKGE